MIKFCALGFLFALTASSQSHSVYICDQQSSTHCVQLTVPGTLSSNIQISFPIGSNQDVIFNNNGSLGADSGNFDYNSSTHVLTVNEISTTNTTGGCTNYQTSGGGTNFLVDCNGNISIGGSGSRIAINGSTGGLGVTANTALNSIQSVGGIASITTSFSSGGGNCTIQAQTSISAISNCTTGATIWSLGQGLSSSGILRLSNATGTGGLDSNGAQIYATASNGDISIVGTYTSTETGSAPSFQTQNSDFIVDGQGDISIGGAGSIISINGSTGGLGITANGAYNSIQTVGGERIGSGAWLGSNASFDAILCGGCYFNGTNYISLNGSGSGTAALWIPDVNGIYFYYNTGLTAGSAFTPALIDTFFASGTTLNNLTVTGTCTGCGTSYWTQSGTNLYYTAGNVGIGTSSPGTALEVDGGPITSSQTGTNIAFETVNGVNNYTQVDGQGDISVSGPGSAISISGSTGGLGVTANTALNSIQTVGGIASITTSFTSGGGNCSILEKTSVSAISNCTTGATIWALGNSSSYGLMRLSNSTGIGGLDGDGAQIYLTASNGNVSAVGTFTSTQASTSAAFQTSNSDFIVDGQGNISVGGTGGSPYNGVISTSSSTGGFNVTANTAANSIQTTGGMLFKNHLSNLGGSAPTIGGTGCSLVTSPTATDTRGYITSTSSSTTCTITFAVAYPANPIVQIGTTGSTIGSLFGTPTTTTFSVSFTSTGTLSYIVID